MSTLQPPDNPIALHRSHLLAPAPDRLTNTPTTLRITRENTVSGHDFSIFQIRNYEDVSSPQRSILLYTVVGRLGSTSQYREIRDAAGQPLLGLKRLWWRGLWMVKRAETEDDLLSADQGWSIRGKMGVRFENALVSRGQRGHRATVSASASHSHREEDPPSYREAMSENFRSRMDNRQSGESSTESDSSLDEITVGKRDCGLPSYDSVRRSSSHSLRDLLDAIEPPAEPAPATASSLSAAPPLSLGASAKTKLKVVQQTRTTAAVMMGRKMIVHIRRDKLLDFNLSGPMPRWEVEIAEGVDLLLVGCLHVHCIGKS
ncbi:hypothetical protein N7495_006151 [Penicillium taxi]|uniref:uncharacterized protein n=1 Tax=Penicillium taxi TaxID=168475 RepID=UPI002545786D|nr:uncharacterized protein N7495_006151 [Penicillium taxi]KAJ5894460.1 hypothetical protein N7495_006151 [Penicillium taxi]